MARTNTKMQSFGPSDLSIREQGVCGEGGIAELEILSDFYSSFAHGVFEGGLCWTHRDNIWDAASLGEDSPFPSPKATAPVPDRAQHSKMEAGLLTVLKAHHQNMSKKQCCKWGAYLSKKARASNACPSGLPHTSQGTPLPIKVIGLDGSDLCVPIAR